MVLIEFFDHRFLSKNPPEIVIETCLISLSIISYLLPKRIDIIHSLNQMLVKNLDLLLSGGNSDSSEVSNLNDGWLIQARMALFYGYFTDILFKEQEEKFNQSIKFLFEAVNYTGDKAVVGHQACETLITLIGDKNIIPRIKPLVKINLSNRILLDRRYQPVADSIHRPNPTTNVLRFPE